MFEQGSDLITVKMVENNNTLDISIGHSGDIPIYSNPDPYMLQK